MPFPDFKRDIVQQLLKRIREPRRLIQVVTGPRQVGKTTAVHQVLEAWQGLAHYATADLPAPPQPVWIEQQWNTARTRVDSGQPVVLVLDEVQKVARWSEVLKNLWDEDTLQERDVRVIILGSSSLLVQAGLTESLAGRFEILHATHWTFAECQKCFGWTMEEYLYFGGYPGAAPLKDEPLRWAQYIREVLIETTLSKDVLMLNRVDKPALLRQLFMLATEYSGQIISYQKLLGQLQDAGNTTTLAHYQHLLEGAGLIKGIPKWHGKVLKRRASSPKWIVLNTALMTAISGLDFSRWRQESSRWGRLVETAVGAHLINSALGTGIDVYYWRDRNREVDLVLQRADQLLAVEVKSGLTKGRIEGLNAFKQKFPKAQLLLVGGDGIPLEELLQRDIKHWFEKLIP
ncbi:ATP-binding protein [candidate division KSB1 bacterium]|nr:ATP-binding protein [candidate division KSB1 bacterium]NIR68547.1 ATP-binding protein [candidate division KSB1 bacterium]NIS27113.1 ATP-binding protein [candidate division KSB1 bacterium]NIT73998.1 ATP-binding protein [candidate division KSB1 bacterium]NIU27857.1 ATP-binding protein [candidate division KSB1 bacterium]